MNFSPLNVLAAVAMAALIAFLATLGSGMLALVAEALFKAWQPRSKQAAPAWNRRQTRAENPGKFRLPPPLKRICKVLILGCLSSIVATWAMHSFCAALPESTDAAASTATAKLLLTCLTAVFSLVFAWFMSPVFIERPGTEKDTPIVFGTTGRFRSR
jgi:hypothetical protein